MRRNRRQVLELLGGAFGWTTAASVGGLAGCRPTAAPPQAIRVPIADLAGGRRVRVLLPNGDPLELRRTGEGIVGRSLLCTHFGCEVRWNEAEASYACPCHDGRFDDRGRVVAGPPSRPLTTVPMRVDGDAVIVELPPGEI